MKEIIKEKVDNSYLFGCIKYKGYFRFYLMPIAYWIINYDKYDPSYNLYRRESNFRNNVLIVNDDNIHLFIEAIKVDEITLEEINIREYGLDEIFVFFIDFDAKLFVNHFPDISVEDYLPNNTWVGKFDDPMNYIPKIQIDKF